VIDTLKEESTKTLEINSLREQLRAKNDDVYRLQNELRNQTDKIQELKLELSKAQA